MVAPPAWRVLRGALALSLAATLATAGLVGAWVERVQAGVLPPLSSHIRLVPVLPGGAAMLSEDDVARLGALRSVSRVLTSRSIDDTVVAFTGPVGIVVPATIRATSPGWPMMAGMRVVAGRGLRPLERDAAVAMVSGPWPGTPTRLVWRGRVLHVVGRLMGASARDEATNQVWVPSEVHTGSRATGSYLLELRDEPNAEASTAESATELLVTRYGRLPSGDPPVVTITYGAQRDAVAVVRRVLYLTLLAFCAIPFVLLGGGVAAALRMAVRRRVPEIGLRRAVGATRQQIVDLVVGEAIRLALGASWRGGLLALFAFGVARLLALPVDVPGPLLFLVAALPWLVCFASAVTPAIEASELQPIEALGRE